MKLRKALVPLMVASAILCSCGSTSGPASDSGAPGSAEAQSEGAAAEESAEASEGYGTESEEEVRAEEAAADNTGAESTEAASAEDAASGAAMDNAPEADETDVFKAGEDKIDLSDVKDTEAAEVFKEFLAGDIGADYDNGTSFLGDLVAIALADSDFDSNTDNPKEYIEDNFSISYLVSEADSPTLYLEIMDVLSGSRIYQIRLRDKKPFVNSTQSLGWSDSVTVYKNGIVGIYHGQSLPSLDCYFDAKDSIIDVFNGDDKVKLLIFGPKSFFGDEFDKVLSEYQSRAENVLVFDEEYTEEQAKKRDEILGVTDDDIIDWKRI